MVRAALVVSLSAAASLVFPLAARTATLELVSQRDPAFLSDTPTGEVSGGQQVSADGRYVVFVSSGANLVPGQIGFFGDTDNVFLYDRVQRVTALVSHAAGATSTTGDQFSMAPVVSADGRFVAFWSIATNLLPGPPLPSFSSGVYLWDRLTGETAMVSHVAGAETAPAGASPSSLCISDDGRFVAFLSEASNLVAGQIQTAGGHDVFLYDRTTRTNILVSRADGLPTTEGSPATFEAGITLSGDGRYVAFTSRAANLVPGQTAGGLNAFLYDRVADAMTLVSHAAGGPANVPANGVSQVGALSADGRYLAYESRASNLVAGQTEASFWQDVFLWDRLAGSSILVSHSRDGATQTLNRESSLGAVSSDGRFVAFTSAATDAVAGQTGAALANVYLFDRMDGSLVLASHLPGSPAASGGGASASGRVSDDGLRVAFTSLSTDLVAGQIDANLGRDVYLFDRTSGAVTLVSHRQGMASQTGNQPVAPELTMTRDGSWIAYSSAASDLDTLIDTNEAQDVFLFERDQARNHTASRRADPSIAALHGAGATGVSADGRWVLFLSDDPHLVPGQSPPDPAPASPLTNLFLYDRLTRAVRLVSHSPASLTTSADFPVLAAILSADGRWVAFSQSASIFSSDIQLYLYERETGALTLVSRSTTAGERGNGSSFALGLSSDGRYMALGSDATNLVAGVTDTPFSQDFFLYDRMTGSITLVSHAASDPAVAVGGSGGATLSADGRFLAFTSDAANLVTGQTGTPFRSNVFLFDRVTGTTTLVSHVSGSATTSGDGNTSFQKISADGRVVLFDSSSRNLIPPFPILLGASLLYLYDRQTGNIVLVSRNGAGQGFPTNYSFDVSADGRLVAFTGQASNPGLDRVYVYDRLAGTLELVSHAAASGTTGATGTSTLVKISADGRFVAFVSAAPDLVAGQQEEPQGDTGSWDVFLYDRAAGSASLVSRRSGTAVRTGGGDLPLLSADGTTVVFAGTTGNLIANDLNDAQDVYLFRRDTHPGAFFSVPPCRLLDTRQAGQGPALASGTTVSWGLYAACGIPSTARAVSINVTIVSPSGAGFLTLFAGDQPLPPTSTINFRAGQVRANNAVVGLAAAGDGALAAFTSIAGNGTVHVVLDVNGYFE